MTTAPLANLDAQVRYAQLLSESSLVPKHLRGNPANVLLYLALAEAHDVPVAVAFRGMTVVGDTPAMAPEMMRAQIQRKGHKIEVVTDTDKECKLRGIRADTGVVYEVSFTMADAQRAGLTNKSTWKQYPKAMLLARATSALGRMGFSDCLNGVSYVPEELGAEVDEEGNAVGGPTPDKPVDAPTPSTPAQPPDGADQPAPESNDAAPSAPAEADPAETELRAVKVEVLQGHVAAGYGSNPATIGETFERLTGMTWAEAKDDPQALRVFIAALQDDIAKRQTETAGAAS